MSHYLRLKIDETNDGRIVLPEPVNKCSEKRYKWLSSGSALLFYMTNEKTISVPESLWQEIEIYCKTQKVNPNEFTAEALRDFLAYSRVRNG